MARAVIPAPAMYVLETAYPIASDIARACDLLGMGMEIPACSLQRLSRTADCLRIKRAGVALPDKR